MFWHSRIIAQPLLRHRPIAVAVLFQSRSLATLQEAYDQLVQSNTVQRDQLQMHVLEELERLRKQLLATNPTTAAASKPSTDAPTPTTNHSSWSWFSQYTATVQQAAVTNNPPSVQGVYLHGGVGCGKTMLMNVFWDTLDDTSWANQRQKIHFHKFMLNVHQEMHAARYGNGGGNIHTGSDAILPAVIEMTKQQGLLICLDEFQVTDVADALILQRLFTGLWEEGCVLVSTSNRPPKELYWNGIQRDRFLPFIDLLEKRCAVVSMWNSETDYRLVQHMQSGSATVYFVGKDSRNDFDKLFYDLAGRSAIAPTSLQTQGRTVAIPQASLALGMARFRFEDLCAKALGAADYLAIGQSFHTVFVEQIPILTLNELNWVRRFIIFVDSMYESNVKLILQAKAPATELFVRPANDDSHDEVFAWDRTVSRLEEMSSINYLQKRWAGSEKAHQQAQSTSLRVEPSLGDNKRGDSENRGN